MENSIYYQSEYQKLCSNLAGGECAQLWIIKGDFGMGKSELIRSVISSRAIPCLKIEPAYGNADSLSAVRNAIRAFLSQKSAAQPWQDNFLPYQDSLKQAFFSLAIQDQFILWINDISLFKDPVILSFFGDIISTVMMLKEQYPIYIFVECSDDNLSPHQQDLLYDISSLTPSENVIRLRTLSHEQLVSYVNYLLEKPYTISQHTINRIIKSGFDNLQYIKRVIECLKDMGTLHVQDSVWHCGDIDTERLYQYLKSHIQVRYNRLSTEQKSVLQKASITGFEIDIELLKKPLGILRAEQKLKQIELISELLEHETTYRFETEEVFLFTLREISDAQRIDLYKTLSNYLEQKLEGQETESGRFLRQQRFYTIANYNKNCGDYLRAFSFYFKCAMESLLLKDYKTITKCCMMAFELLDVLSPHEYTLQMLHFLAANAKQGIGEFAEAEILWDCLLNIKRENPPIYDMQKVKYQRAYCQRRAGAVLEAYQNLKALEVSLKPKPSELFADILIVLTGIADQLGEKDDKIRYYNWSLDISQQLPDRSRYYRLLGKSNMFYTAGVALPKMQQAFEYFNQTSDRIETGKIAYNIGMSSIQNSEFSRAKESLQYALEIFISCGSRNVSYIYCAEGILYGLNEEYGKAQEYFERTIALATNTFAQITAKLNIFYCLQKTNRLKDAEILLDECEAALMESGDDKLVLQRNFYFAKAMLARTVGETQKAYSFICTAYEIEKVKLKYSTYNIYLARWIQRLAEQLNIEIPADIYEMAEKHLTDYKQRCYDQNVMWGNLMFW